MTSPSFIPSMRDQLGQSIDLLEPAKRIVSLVPSQTELLFDLGLDEEIVGVTKFCIHPKGKTGRKKVVGGTKNFRFDVIDQLQPDLIIGNKEENYQEGIDRLREKYPVWMSDVVTLEDALAMMRSLGQLSGKSEKAHAMADRISIDFEKLALETSLLPSPPRVAYLIWRQPFMAAANGTFIHSMLKSGGWDNVFASENRYPEIGEEQLREAAPEVIFLSSEPYPFSEKHLVEVKNICPEARIMLVDGSVFSWYGSRLLQATAYFRELRRQLKK
jgi:ABC-type Fe3+-hydroxamate transport system substrate-binding protein